MTRCFRLCGFCGCCVFVLCYLIIFVVWCLLIVVYILQVMVLFMVWLVSFSAVCCLLLVMGAAVGAWS